MGRRLGARVERIGALSAAALLVTHGAAAQAPMTPGTSAAAGALPPATEPPPATPPSSGAPAPANAPQPTAPPAGAPGPTGPYGAEPPAAQQPPPSGYAYGAAGPASAPAGAPIPYGSPPGYGAPPGYGQPEGEGRAETEAEWTPSQPGFALAIERIVSVGGVTLSPDSGDSRHATNVSLAGNSGIGGFLNPFVAPIASVHGVFARGVTLGMGFGFFTGSSGDTPDDLSWSSLTIAPRIGYIATVSSVVAIWAKAGLTYVRQSITAQGATVTCDASGCTQVSASSEDTISFYDFTLDPALMVFPIPHIGFLVEPVVDIGVGSTVSSDSSASSDGTKVTNYGLTAGLAVIF